MNRMSRSKSFIWASAWRTWRASSRRASCWLGVEPDATSWWANSRDDWSGSATSRATERRAAMSASHVGQPFIRLLPQPNMERHRPLSQKLTEPAKSLQLRFLDYIVGIDAGPQARVKPDCDELLQQGAMPGEQATICLPTARLGLAQQLLRGGGIGN